MRQEVHRLTNELAAQVGGAEGCGMAKPWAKEEDA